MRSDSLDEAIARLAQRQRGYVTQAQLLALGLGEGAIKYRKRINRLIEVYRGVYAVGHLPVSPDDHAFAAVLACGPDAVLSHHSALWLWDWCRPRRPPFEVTAPSRHRRPGIKVHVSTRLTRRDVTRHLGIRVTSPARTMLDVAPSLDGRGLRRTVREARLSKLLRLSDLEDVLERFPRHPGARRLVPYVLATPLPTRSQLEDEFLAFCIRFGLPRPEVNVRVGPYLVDALFRAERVIVELDGYQYHHDRETFEGDRERDADNLCDGFVTLRLTWERMSGTPRREAERLHAILRSRRR